MDTQKLLNTKPKPKIIARVSNVENLVKISSKIKLASVKLRKTFEKGSYQKRTQLSILRRYKRRLDSIYGENDKKLSKKQRVKIKPLEIKKYVGNLFTSGASDPFKSIAALAAFNAASKIGKGKPFEALGPALVAGGLLLGPGLIKAGASRLFNRGGIIPRGLDRYGRRVSKPVQQRYAQRYGDKAFKNRFGNRNLKNISQGNAGTERFLLRSGKAFSRFGGMLIPGIGAGFATADAAARLQSGDQTGAAISSAEAVLNTAAVASAATGIGLAAVPFLEVGALSLGVINLVRDITGISDKESEKNSIEKKLKEQSKNQKKSVDAKKGERGKLTFRKTLNSYERSVNKFEQFSKNFINLNGRDANENDSPTNPNYRPPDPTFPDPQGLSSGDFSDQQVVSDAKEFRKQFPLPAGTPIISTNSVNLHMRENTMLFGAGIGNDPTVDPVHRGSHHYNNTAIDIPVGNRQDADKVIQFWKSRGYYVLDEFATGGGHIHVQWDRGTGNTITSGGDKKGYIIIPGHASGGGDPGEKELVKKLALDAYNKIKKKDPNAPVQFMDVDSQFPDNDAGWANQKKWYKKMEADGYEVLEIHMDQAGGMGKGVIRSHGQQSGPATEFAKKYGAYPMDWRSKPGEQPLAGPHRNVDLFELGKMNSRFAKGNITQREMSQLTSEFASMDFSSNSLKSNIRNVVRNARVDNRNIASYPTYTPGPRQQQVINIPVPIPAPKNQSQVVQQSFTPYIGGPSEEQVLNSFYKRVLLNTLQ